MQPREVELDALLDYAWSSSQPGAGLVAASVAGQESAEQSGGLLQFVRTGSEVDVVRRFCNRWPSGTVGVAAELSALLLTSMSADGLAPSYAAPW